MAGWIKGWMDGFYILYFCTSEGLIGQPGTLTPYYKDDKFILAYFKDFIVLMTILNLIFQYIICVNVISVFI